MVHSGGLVVVVNIKKGIFLIGPVRVCGLTTNALLFMQQHSNKGHGDKESECVSSGSKDSFSRSLLVSNLLNPTATTTRKR